MKKRNNNIPVLAALLGILPLGSPLAAESAAQTNAYFGAVHVHTYYSFDAYTNGTVSFDYLWDTGAFPQALHWQSGFDKTECCC